MGSRAHLGDSERGALSGFLALTADLPVRVVGAVLVLLIQRGGAGGALGGIGLAAAGASLVRGG